MILEDFSELPKPDYGRFKETDPALLTFQDWAKLVNAEKSHPSYAYDMSLAELNQYGDETSKFSKLIQRIRVHNLDFELKMQSIKRNFAKTDPSGEYLRDEQNNLIYYTDQEIKLIGWNSHTYEFAIFNDQKQKIGYATPDEWGCVLVVVAKEYRNFGFGDILGKAIYTVYPTRSTGGTTSSGFKALRRTHQLFVADALRNGRYRLLIEQNKITYQKVKEICNSAGLPRAPKKRTEKNLSSNDPKDWILYSGGYGDFILYDKKLKDVYKDSNFDHFAEDFIKGMIYVAPGEKYGIIWTFGGETKMIRSFLLRCATTFCEQNDCLLMLDVNDKETIDPKFFKIGKKNLKSGYWRYPIKVKEPLDATILIQLEEKWRKTFDQYDEFKNYLIETAEGKFKTD